MPKFYYNEITIKLISTKPIDPDGLDEVSELMTDLDYSKGDWFVIVNNKEVTEDEAKQVLAEIFFSMDDIIDGEEEEEDDDL